MVWSAGPAMLWEQLLRMGWGTLAACIGIWGIAYVLNALSWRTVLDCLSSQRVGFWAMIRYTISGYALNYITPMGLLGGEPYRVWALKNRVGLESATSSVMLYAMMHFCSHFLFWLIGCCVALIVIAEPTVSLLTLLAVVSVICLLLLFLFLQGYRSGIVVRLLDVLSHLPWLGSKVETWQQRNEATLRRIDIGISSLLSAHKGAFYGALFLELAARLVCCFELLVIGRAIGLSLDYADCLLISAFSSLLANLLFFSPLQMGTREGGIAWALLLIGVGSEAEVLLPLAVTLSMGTRIREFAWIAFGGLLSLFGRER